MVFVNLVYVFCEFVKVGEDVVFFFECDGCKMLFFFFGGKLVWFFFVDDEDDLWEGSFEECFFFYLFGLNVKEGCVFVFSSF